MNSIWSDICPFMIGVRWMVGQKRRHTSRHYRHVYACKSSYCPAQEEKCIRTISYEFVSLVGWKKKKRRLKLWDQIALVGGKEGWEIRTTRESSWTERKRKRGKEWTIQKKMTNPWKRRVHDEKIRWVIKTTEIRETSARKTRRHDTEWEGKECVTEKLGKRQRGTEEPHYCSTLDRGSKPQKTPQNHINEENEAHTHDANHP